MAGSRGIRAGRAFVELGVSDRLSAGLRRAQRRLQAFGAGVRQVGLRLVAAGVAALAPLAATVRIFAKAGDELEKMSRRTGVSVEALSELGFAAEQSGADLETVEKGVKTMQRAIVDLGRGLSTQVDAFGALGLTLKDLQNLKPEEQFKIIADRLSQVEDATTRAGLAAQLFGRAGTRLLPLFEQGAAGMEALQLEARRLGLTISTETARDTARLTDAFNIVRRVLKVTAITVGSTLAPALERAAKFVTRIAIVTSAWIKQNKQAVVTAAKIALTVVAVGSALVAVGLLLALAGTAFGGLAAIVTTAAAVVGAVTAAFGFLVSPIGLVIAAVALATVAFLKFSGGGSKALEFLGDKFRALKGIVSKTLGGIGDALAAGDIALAAKVLWAGLRLTFLEGTKEISESFASAFLVMRLVMVDALAIMQRLWTSFASGVQSVWEKTVNAVAKGVTVVLGVFDSSLDVEAANRQLDADSRANLDAISKRTEAELKRINEIRDLSTAGVLDDAAKKMQERIDALKQAKDDLDTLLKEARDKRDAAGAQDTAAPSSGRDRFSDFIDEFDAIGEGIKRSIETRGTFNALAAQGLASGATAADRTAKATEQTAINTLRIRQALNAGGATFA
ncbi:MAG: hypothetical protein H6813_02570 [Phycisphaeraceae bacterium]|nr:hypothetical protein [Phycisphaeraceae bacterium]MCB9848800.1 hypothetical protein [Phycisphaeraceae bacterium]